jgi:FAD/FMN-containing dehydrogenase
LPEFLPKLLKILKDNKIAVNIVGHAGSGNLHIIPLMDLHQESERAKITKVSDEVYDLVVEYGGTITAEHNDGIIRTPYVKKMFGEEMYSIFEQVKNIFDPHNIFNPGKKVGGTVQYIEDHIAGK